VNPFTSGLGREKLHPNLARRRPNRQDAFPEDLEIAILFELRR